MTFPLYSAILTVMTKDARSLPLEAQADLRRKLVLAVRDGMKKGRAAELFGVHRGTASRWISADKAGGLRALKAGRRGRPRSPSLKPLQAALAVRLIEGRCPDQLRLPFALWTRDAVVKLLKARFGLKVSVWTAGRYLRGWGFTPQKPARRAYEQCPVAVRRWLEVEYPAIAARARREGAEIHWCDETGLRSDHQSGTTWGRRGVTPVVPGTGRRFGCNVISAITNRGQLSFMVFEGKMTAQRFTSFLARLIRQRRRKVFLISDRHSSHVAWETNEWLSLRRKEIELFFIPTYSPELNPDELVNQDLKLHTGRRRPADLPALVRGLRGRLKSHQRRPQRVRRFFQKREVLYAA